MKVILKKDIEKLGSFGEIVDVKDGYARNYLLPKGFVWPAEDKYRKRVESLKAKIETQKAKEFEQAKEKADRIEDTSVTIEVEVGEDEKLYGSVTNIDIAGKLNREDLDVDKRNIKIDEPIRKLGVYKVKVKVHPKVEATCKVWVVKK